MSGYGQEPSGMRRRHVDRNGSVGGGVGGRPAGGLSPHDDDKNSKALRRRIARNLDMFPKVESDLTVRTDRGGMVSLVGFGLVLILLIAEVISWRAENRAFKEHVRVDKSLGKKMRVEMNITFPALHCDDLHVDAMDVAGDSQIDVEDTLVKMRLRLDGRPLSGAEIQVETNKAAEADREKRAVALKGVPEDYCGPCYGAHVQEDQCCDTCDDVIQAYKDKRWNWQGVAEVAEQCKREGKKVEPKRMSRGEGCNLSGHMLFNRVAGNFHIAMGEGVERDGRHIHQFVPEDAPNFNVSHVIHSLSFGPDYRIEGETRAGRTSLNGVRKIVTEENGSTGLFQYFIKVVPTKFRGKDLGASSLPGGDDDDDDDGGEKGGKDANDDDKIFETNRYFFTERFRPLMTDADEKEEHKALGEDGKLGAHVGGSAQGSHDHAEHHKVQNAVLPGVFFVYEIYPFSVEVTRESVPFTHLLIRIMATAGGVLTIVGMADRALYAREKKLGR